MKKSKLKRLVACTLTAVALTGCTGAEETVETVSENETTQQTIEQQEETKEQEAVESEITVTPSTEAETEVYIEDKPEINEQETEEPDYVIDDTKASQESTTQKSALSKELTGLPTDADIQAMSAESSGWGQGTQTDDLNRPAGCLQYQEKFGSHAVRFIMDDSEEKNIYLTFDEGYENGYTPAILDTLKEKNVKAVFFITMDYAKKEPELVQRMIDEGHVVGNHSVTHPSAGLPSQSLEQQENEVMELHNYVKENFGYEMYLFRFPAGIFSEQSLGILDKCGYTGVFWSFAYHDWDPDNQMAYGEALEKTVECLHPGAVYLLHAVSSTNTQILGEFIDTAVAQGYTFK